MSARDQSDKPEDAPKFAPVATARVPLTGLAVVLSLLVGAVAGIVVYRYSAMRGKPQTPPPAQIPAPVADNQPPANNQLAGNKPPVASGPSEVQKIDFQLVNGEPQVTIVLDQSAPYDAHRLDQPDRVYIDFHGARLSSNLAGKTILVNKGNVSRIRLAQTGPDAVRVVLDLERRFDYSVTAGTNPVALVVKLNPYAPPRKRRPPDGQSKKGSGQ